MSDRPKRPPGPRQPGLLTDLFRDPLDPGYADAAARRAGGGSPPRRPTTRTALVLVLVLVGLLFAVAYRQVVAEEPTRTQVRADLEEQVRERQEATDALQERAQQLRDEVGQLRDGQLGDPAQVEQLRRLEVAAGVVRVRGDGLVVEVGDGPPEVDPATGAAVTDPQARVLDVDLQRITNDLWAAGAEAVAINGRRLGATSTIRGASGAILVDRVPVAGPYVVSAIGSDQLAAGYAGSAADRLMAEVAQSHGISYEVRPESDLVLPAATAPQLDHAAPVGGTS